MNVIYTIIAFLVGFTLMVLVHEWGHYITGRMFKAKIDEFALGMGPKIYQRRSKKTNVLFSLRSIPIGGFVKFTGDDEVYGEQAPVTDEKDPYLLPNLAVWKRFIIYAAGAFMNIVLGFVLIVGLLGIFGIETTIPEVGSVIENTPGYTAGLQAGDRFVSINGTVINTEDNLAAVDQISSLIVGGGELNVVVERDGELVDLVIIPEYDEESKTYKVGFYFGAKAEHLPFGELIVTSARTAGNMMTMIYQVLGNLIFKGEGAENIGGPVAIISVISSATRQGIMSVISVFASLTLNLAVVNMLPFPALDGGKCLLLIIEGITRKPINKKVEGWINLVGFAVLMLLMVLVGAKDIFNLIAG